MFTLSVFRVYKVLPRARKIEFYIVMLVSLLASFAEVVSIGAVIPFLTFLTNPTESLNNIVFFKGGYPDFISNLDNQQLFFTLIFILAALVSGCIRAYLLRIQSIFAFKIGGDLGSDIYKKVLSQPYSYHVNANSSELIATITTKTDEVVGSIILPFLKLISSVLIITLVLGLVMWLNPVLLTVLIGALAIIYYFFGFVVKGPLTKNGEIISNNTNLMVLNLQEGIGGIRDVIMDHSQNHRRQLFLDADVPRRKAMADNQFLGQFPKFAVETLGIILLACVAFILSQAGKNNLSSALPLLGALAIGSQKVLPLIQQVFRTWSLLRGSKKILDDTLSFFNLKDYMSAFDKFDASAKKLTLEKEIIFDNISYSHKGSHENILSEFNLKIIKGSTIGIVGETGSGKSTFLDVFMGLLQASSGTILIDGKPLIKKNILQWRNNIAHIPQSIFISDATIMENIAFNVPIALIDRDLVMRSAKAAEINQFISNLADGYDTVAGERGIKFSGGQRQRLGIARALYKNYAILVLDEATSALDSITEARVIQNIKNNSVGATILMVAHRIDTLKNCDLIIKIENQKPTIVKDIEQLRAINDYETKN